MYGNGATIGIVTIITHKVRAITHTGRVVEALAFCAAAAGSTGRSAAAWLIASTATRLMAAALSVFVSHYGVSFWFFTFLPFASKICQLRA